MEVTKVPKKIVTVIEPKRSMTEKKKKYRQKRVAAYCRVSTDSEEQLVSYANQKKVYTEMIASRKDWCFAGLFADEGKSGTRADKRPEFNKMINDCLAGKIDYIITCALPGFVDSKNEEKTERNAGYLVVSHSGGGMLRQGTRKGIRRTPANRGMRAHWVVKGLDISEDVCHGMCP